MSSAKVLHITRAQAGTAQSIYSNDTGENAKTHNAQSQHVIKTLSAIQARQPIYQSSAQIPDELTDFFRFT